MPIVPANVYQIINQKFKGVVLIRNALLGEIDRLAPKPKDRIPATNSDCSFVCYINDGRGDLKSCGTVIRMCIAKDHHKFQCGAGKDHTYPLSLVDRALIMGLAVLYERESGYPWSITHRPTEAFRSCFPVKSLPSTHDKEGFLKAVQELVQQGVMRWSKEKSGETAVAERIRPPLEGLLGWHDFCSEDGSFNKDAHSSVDQTTIEMTHPASNKPIEKTLHTSTVGEADASSSQAASLSISEMPQPSSSKAIVRSGERVQLSKTTKGLGAQQRKGAARPVKYTEIHSRKHAASASSRRHNYIATLLIPDSDAEDDADDEADVADVDETKRSSKKRKYQ